MQNNNQEAFFDASIQQTKDI